MSNKQSYNDLVKEYRRLAKRADQRLVRLEKLSEQEGFKKVKQYAYKRAAYDAAEWGADPMKPRFNIAPPKNKTSLRAKIQDIINFLDMPSSTKAGIVKIYEGRAQTLNNKYKEYNLNLSWSDIADFFDSALYKKMSKKFGSDVAVKTIATIKHNEGQVLKDFKNKQASHVKTESDDLIVDEAIKRATRYYKKDVKAALKLL